MWRLLVDHADQEEQRARAQAVVDHLQDAALDALRVEGEQAEHDETQVADRGIGDQLLDVGLGVGDRRAVDDADDRQHARCTGAACTAACGNSARLKRRKP